MLDVLENCFSQRILKTFSVPGGNNRILLIATP